MEIKKGQIIEVTIPSIEKGEFTFVQTVLLGGNAPDFKGEVLVVSPTAEEFAELDENFKDAVLHGTTTEDLVNAVVYYDKGAGRNFVFEKEEVQIIEGGN